MLALIAGQGRLPAILFDRLSGAGQRPLVAELEGFAAGTPVPADMIFRLETLGSFFSELRSRGVSRVAFAGRVRRPVLDPDRVDSATGPLFGNLTSALRDGDDGALRVILDLFEAAGFDVVPAHEIAPDLLPETGVLTVAQPAPLDTPDTARGMAVIAAMAKGDIGQACVVSQGVVLAVEAAAGTDWMLETLKERPDDLPAGGLLIKAPKPGQDRRADMPTIGPETLRAAAAAGLTGVVVEAGGVLVVDVDEAVAEADRLGLFLWVRSP